jgi:hypothetical protein
MQSKRCAECLCILVQIHVNTVLFLLHLLCWPWHYFFAYFIFSISSNFATYLWRMMVSNPVSKTNQVLPICMPRSSFIHIVTSLVNNGNNITKRKRSSDIYSRIQGSKCLKLHRQSAEGFVRLAPSGLHTPSPEQRFSKGEYTYGWYSARPQK